MCATAVCASEHQGSLELLRLRHREVRRITLPRRWVNSPSGLLVKGYTPRLWTGSSLIEHYGYLVILFGV